MYGLSFGTLVYFAEHSVAPCGRRRCLSGHFGIGLQRAVRHAVAVGLLPPAASRHLLAARLAVRRRAASIAAYYSDVLVVAIIPGMHYFFMP